MAGVDAERRVRVVVSGVVQGVGFRWFVVRNARTLGVAGWVRNRADGSVEFIARGAVHAVTALIEAARVGPRSAVVRDVSVTEPPADARYLSPFDVKNTGDDD